MSCYLKLCPINSNTLFTEVSATTLKRDKKMGEKEERLKRLCTKSALASIPSKSVSKLYNDLFLAGNENTLYIKEKWEKEAGISMSEEAWGEICSFQWSSANSTEWREHCWKKHSKIFLRPHTRKNTTLKVQCVGDNVGQWRQTIPTYSGGVLN